MVSGREHGSGRAGAWRTVAVGGQEHSTNHLDFTTVAARLPLTTWSWCRTCCHYVGTLDDVSGRHCIPVQSSPTPMYTHHCTAVSAKG